MPSDPTDNRRLTARIAAHTSWANTTDRTARTAPARAALEARFADQVDPDRVLPPAERAQRATSARKAYYAALAAASARARAARLESTRTSPSADSRRGAAARPTELPGEQS